MTMLNPWPGRRRVCRNSLRLPILVCGLAWVFLAFSMILLLPGKSLSLAAETDDWPVMADIEAAAFLVADAGTGELIISQNIETPVYPASLTKIMTAMLLIDSGLLEEKVTVSEYAVDLSYDMARVGFLAGESVRLHDVLYGLMLASGNDAARVTAEALAGSEEAFSELMNQKARELGMLATRFRNASGLHDDDHQTTAADMLLLVRYAMGNEIFRQVASAPVYAMPATSHQPYRGWAMLVNTNLFLLFGEDVLSSDYYQSYTGIKTGTTRAAGYCLAASAQSWNDDEFVLLLFGVDRNKPRSYLYQYGHVLFEQAARQLDLPVMPDPDDPSETATPEPVSDSTTAEAPMPTATPQPSPVTEATEPTDQASSGRLEQILLESPWRTAFFGLLLLSLAGGIGFLLWKDRRQ